MGKKKQKKEKKYRKDPKAVDKRVSEVYYYNRKVNPDIISENERKINGFFKGLAIIKYKDGSFKKRFKR